MVDIAEEVVVILFERPLTFGVAVGVRVDEIPDLHPLAGEERAHALSLGEGRRGSFVAGRAALRRALELIGIEAGDLPPAPRGAPTVPGGARGTVSHKGSVAVALARRELPGARVAIGVDLEAIRPRRIDVSSRILREAELARSAALDPSSRDLAVLVTFSIKEAIYKAIDPFVARWVGFKEVELGLGALEEGSVAVTPYLEPAPPSPLTIEAAWRRIDGPEGPRSMILSEARAVPG